MITTFQDIRKKSMTARDFLDLKEIRNFKRIAFGSEYMISFEVVK